MKMVDVGAKERTVRRAVARGAVVMSAETLRRVREGTAEKGDIVAAARIAGVMAAKKTPEIVPLCHPIALSHVEVRVEADEKASRVLIEATAEATDRTGVEMEALTAVAAAALTVYDMLKQYERGMRIEAIELLHKSGGRSGTWEREPERT